MLPENVPAFREKLAKIVAEKGYFNPTPIKTKLDLDGDKPSIHLITSNRSDGKTTAFAIDCLLDFYEFGSQFGYVYRLKAELSGTPSIFADVMKAYPELGCEMRTKAVADGLFYELIIDDFDGTSTVVGYSYALKTADDIKRHSPLFGSVDTLIMEEYQKETGSYLKNEISLLQSLMISIGRGNGEQSRHLNVYLLGNLVTLMNPYLIYFGIHKRLKDNTKFIRGNGWVAQFNFNEHSASAIQNNAMFKAFQQSDYMKYSTENVYLNDATVFIQKPKGRSNYIITIKHEGKLYGVREYTEEGYVYISNKPDPAYNRIITFHSDDHNKNTLLLSPHSYTVQQLKQIYSLGLLRFDSIQSKFAMFDILSI